MNGTERPPIGPLVAPDGRHEALLAHATLRHVVEAVSHSTASFDRGQKFEDSRALPTLRACVPIDSTRRSVEVRRPDANGDVSAMTPRDAEVLELPEIGIAVPVVAFYEQSGIA